MSRAESLSRARGVLTTVAGVLAFWATSCRDIPAPEGGVASVGGVLLPSPGLVVGDTMRDSMGVAKPLRVVAFGIDGQPLNPQPTASFIVLDSTAHITAGAFLIGDTIGKTAVVGEVERVQTRPEIVTITLSPDTLTASDSVLHRPTYSIAKGDTISDSGNLAVKVSHVVNNQLVSAVEAVIVRYSVSKGPAGTQTVVLRNGNAGSLVDTTDANGVASLVARLRLNALTTFNAETAVVRAHASHRGRVIGFVDFTIIYTKQP